MIKRAKSAAKSRKKVKKSDVATLSAAVPVPTVTVFGSCRVVVPLKLAEKNGQVHLGQKDIYGFVHSSSEIIQQIDIITGNKIPPSRLKPYLNMPKPWTAPKDVVSPDSHFNDANVFVMEISASRTIRFKAFELQSVRTRRLLDVDAVARDVWWKKLVDLGVNDLTTYLSMISPTPLQLEVASQLKVLDLDKEQIKRDVRSLVAMFDRPVLFVSHFNASLNGGASIARRQVIIEALSEMPDIHFWDPTPLMNEYGVEKAILDTAHYTPGFEEEVGRALALKVRSIADFSERNPMAGKANLIESV